MSLVGPGTAEEVWARHYGEALAGLGLLDDVPAGSTLVDIGSGAGFPGFVLAAARPDLSVVLVEAQERKWAFLRQAARKAALPCLCLNVRVTEPLPTALPETFDVLALRALRLPAPVLTALGRRLVGPAKLLAWESVESGPETSARSASSGLIETAFEPGRQVRLGGSERRYVVEYLFRRHGERNLGPEG